MSDPLKSYRDDRSCRVKGCDRPAVVVVPTRIRFPSSDNADPRGLASVNVSIVFCREHSADAIAAIRDQQCRVGARSADGAGVRAFERFLSPEERSNGDSTD